MTTKDKVFIKTPVGVMLWPWLQKPDTQYKKEGEYHLKIRFDKSSAALNEVLDKMQAVLDAFHKEESAKSKKPIAKGDIPVIVEGNATILKASMIATGTNRTTGEEFTQKPALFDRFGNPWDETVRITNGSSGLFEAEVYPYVVKGTVGVKLRLKRVQLATLAEGSGTSPAIEPIEDEAGDF